MQEPSEPQAAVSVAQPPKIPLESSPGEPSSAPAFVSKVANIQLFVQERFLPWAGDSELSSWKKYHLDVAFMEG